MHIQHLHTNASIFTHNCSNIRWSDELYLHLRQFSKQIPQFKNVFIRSSAWEWLFLNDYACCIKWMLIAVKRNRLFLNKRSCIIVNLHFTPTLRPLGRPTAVTKSTLNSFFDRILKEIWMLHVFRKLLYYMDVYAELYILCLFYL